VIGFLVFAPWLQVTHKYDAAFKEQPRLVSKAWCVVLKSWLAFSSRIYLLEGSRCFKSRLPIQARASL
jgi:hypothetical protein